MEPEGSSSCLQEPDIDPYSEPDETNSYTSTNLSIRSILILSYHIGLGLQSGSYLQVLKPKICTCFLCPHASFSS
jgi:hypothetical protein